MSSWQNPHRAGNTDGSWREERANLDKIRVNWPMIDFVVFPDRQEYVGWSEDFSKTGSWSHVAAPNSFSNGKWKLQDPAASPASWRQARCGRWLVHAAWSHLFFKKEIFKIIIIIIYWGTDCARCLSRIHIESGRRYSKRRCKVRMWRSFQTSPWMQVLIVFHCPS